VGCVFCTSLIVLLIIKHEHVTFDRKRISMLTGDSYVPTTWIANLQNYEKHIHIFWQLMKFYETCTHEKMVLTWESMIFLLKTQ